MNEDSLRGLTPSVQDILAVAIIAATYLLRIGSAGDPEIGVPYLLTITTDVILPVMAGAWLFVTAFFVVLKQVGEV